MNFDLTDFLNRASGEIKEVVQGKKDAISAGAEFIGEEIKNGDVRKGLSAASSELSSKSKVTHLDTRSGDFQDDFAKFSNELKARASSTTENATMASESENVRLTMARAKIRSDASDAERSSGNLRDLRTHLDEAQSDRPILEEALKEFQEEYTPEFEQMKNLPNELDDFYSAARRLNNLEGEVDGVTGELKEASDIELKAPETTLRSLSVPETTSSEVFTGLMNDVANELLQVVQLLGQMYILDPVMQAASNGKPGIHVEWDVIKSGLGGITSDFSVDVENVQAGGPIPEGLANAYKADKKGTQWLFAVMSDLVHKHGPGGDDPLLLEELPGARGEQYRGSGSHIFAKMVITEHGLKELPLDLRLLSDQAKFLQSVSMYLGEDVTNTSTAFGVFKKYIFDPRLEDYNNQVHTMNAHIKKLDAIKKIATNIELDDAYIELKKEFYQETNNYIKKVEEGKAESAKFKIAAAKETYEDILEHSDELRNEVFKYHDNFDTLLDLKEFLSVSKGGPTSKPRPEHLNISVAGEFATEFFDFIDEQVKDKETYSAYVEMLRDDSSHYISTTLSHLSEFKILV